jgi:hypothetical protein
MQTQRNKQSGQMLLIIILLSTVLLTVALSVSQITTQETKISKLEEDSKRAFAAAEAGIEARLQSTTGDINIPDLLPNADIASGIATLTTNQGSIFYAPTPVLKDQQLTFYLKNYVKKTNAFDGLNMLNGKSLTLYFGTTANAPCLELTILDVEAVLVPSFKRGLINACGALGPQDLTYTSGIYTFPQKTFKFKTDLAIGYVDNYELLLVRVLFPGASSKESTYLLFESKTSDLPIQGSIVTSDAKTTTNVAKKIELYQSYPQIPADLFVTSF